MLAHLWWNKLSVGRTYKRKSRQAVIAAEVYIRHFFGKMSEDEQNAKH